MLAGVAHTDETSRSYLADLHRAAGRSNIQIATDVAPEHMRKLFNSAGVFWHAAGYGRSRRHPERAEHFGIATVEAMAHGCVPVVYGDGGQPEIVVPGTGLIWRDTDELLKATVELYRDPSHRLRLARAASRSTERFSFDEFHRGCENIFSH